MAPNDGERERPEDRNVRERLQLLQELARIEHALPWAEAAPVDEASLRRRRERLLQQIEAWDRRFSPADAGQLAAAAGDELSGDGQREGDEVIIRVVRGRVEDRHIGTFNARLRDSTIPSMLDTPGLVALDFGRSLADAAQRFVFVTIWQDADSMARWTGPDVMHAKILDGVAELVSEVSVEYFEALAVHWPGTTTPGGAGP
jgi:heme-degrading monooxygenase HmoA